MTVLIKYCGGCNPWYDRIAFVEQLRQEFSGVEFLYSGSGPAEADIVLLVCGCPVKCIACGPLYGRLAVLTAASPEEFGAVKKTLRDFRRQNSRTIPDGEDT
jgi:hypothetical protein